MSDKNPSAKPASTNAQSAALQIGLSTQTALVNDIGLSIGAVRLILSGNSVIDWDRANFRTVEEVNRFLKVQHFDLDDPVDRKRIRVIFDTAVDFLENHLQMPCDEDVKVADIYGRYFCGHRTTT